MGGIREFKSGLPGPRLLVFGAIHGNEVCGARALERLASEFESGLRRLLRGSCVFVPVCNERAFASGTRFVEENLNRVFCPHENETSYERQLANRLSPLMKECDFFLDLHSMQSEGDPFAFLNTPSAGSEKLCRSLGVRWIVTGWPELYSGFPDKDSCCTQTYADRLGVPNTLVECGTHGAPEADEVAYRSTLRCLAHLGLVAEAPPVQHAETLFLKLTDLRFRESAEDRFVKVWKNFEPIREGEVVGYRADGKPERAPRDGFIVFPSPVSAVGTEWFYVAVADANFSKG
jgi:predicted deacylase